MSYYIWNGFLILLTLLFKIDVSCAGLYDDNDEVVILSGNNFDDNIVGSNNSWIVEFYNSWCGHCIRFAPFWKNLANDCKGWKRLMRVAAVDCAEKENTAVCMHYRINMYPTIVYLSAASSSRPERMELSNVDSIEGLKKQMITFMSNHSLSNLTHQLLLPLTPLESIEALKLEMHEKAVVIQEDPDSYLGREIILDMYEHSGSVAIRRIVSNDSVVNIPTSYLFLKDGKMSLLIRSANKTEHLKVIGMLRGKKDERKGAQLHESVSGLGGNEKGTGALNLKNKLHIVDDPQVDWKSYSYLKLHESDLISALLYSLRHEIPLQGHIIPENFILILNYLKVLIKYLPVKVQLIEGLESIVETLQVKKDEKDFDGINGEEWLEIVDEALQKKDYPDANDWITCKGSSAMVRGYPCGLWMTFHSVTINAAQKGEKDADCIQALLSVRDYVQNFFGCQECRINFMKGAVKINSLVKNCNQAAIFLWRSHNKANIKLSGDPSEDPKHPKTIFPNEYQCPSCRANPSGAFNATSFSGLRDGWDEGEVLKFLKNMYGHSGIAGLHGLMNYHLTNKRRPDSRNFPVVGGGDGHKRLEEIDNLKAKIERVSMKVERNSVSFMSVVNIFNRYDVGMCMAFYLVCILLILGLYLHFMRKRRSCLTSAKSKHQV